MQHAPQLHESSHWVKALRDVVGPEALLTDPEKLMVYECDAYTLEKKLPQAVVLPGSADEAAQVIKICHEHQLPLIPRGAGTSLSGAVLAVDGGITICLSRMQKILEVDQENGRALVEAGCVNAWISREVASLGLFYAPDPSSQFACTIGGNVATNSGGPHTLKYGVTTNHVLGFEMILSDGEKIWLGTSPEGGEDHEGLDLRGVAIGSEGMFGLVTEILVKLTPKPECLQTFLGIFETVESASRTVSDIIKAGIVPGALEMMDQLITRAIEEAYHFGFPLDAGALLIIELDGPEAGMENQVAMIEAICMQNRAREIRRAQSEEERAQLWKCRKRAFGAIGRISPNYLTQDGVVPRSKLPEIMDFIQACSKRVNLRIPNVFHAGDGNIHPLILFDEREPDQVKRAIQAGEDILEKCLELGGSVSGEHGIGVEKVDFMVKQFTPSDLKAMIDVRTVFDPKQRCNPHKMFPTSKRCIDFNVRKQAPA